MKNAVHGQRISNKWGLVEKVRQTCLHYKVEALVIENAASGSTVADELRRLYAGDPFIIYLEKPKGDKVERAKAVQPLFAQKMIICAKSNLGRSADLADGGIPECQAGRLSTVWRRRR